MNKFEFLINNKHLYRLKNQGVYSIVECPVTQDYIDFASDRSFYLATMPRSGTNYMEYFFNYFNSVLEGEIDYENPMPSGLVKIGWTAALEKNLGFKWFLISHNYCPGFEVNCDLKFKRRWNNISKKWSGVH